MTTYRNRLVTAISNSPGAAGALTIAAAASGYRTFGAGDDGLSFDVSIVDDTAWEIRTGCIYTNSGTSLSRGTLADSSTGSAIALTSSAVVTVTAVASFADSLAFAMMSHISGIVITKGTGNTITVSAGYAYVPASDRVLSFAGVSSASAGTLGASQWSQVYLYDNAGTASLEVVNNVDPTSTTYAGTARQGGTGSNRRWVGGFLTDASSNIVGSSIAEIPNGYRATGPAGVRCLSAGSATTFTVISLAAVAPKYATVGALFNSLVTARTAGTDLNLSLNGTNIAASCQVPGMASPAGFGASIFAMPVFLNSGVPSIYYKVTTGTTMVYLDVGGYEVTR